MVSRWKTDFLEKELAVEKERVARLERRVGQLTHEVDWLKKNLEAGQLKTPLEK